MQQRVVSCFAFDAHYAAILKFYWRSTNSCRTCAALVGFLRHLEDAWVVGEVRYDIILPNFAHFGLHN